MRCPWLPGSLGRAEQGTAGSPPQFPFKKKKNLAGEENDTLTAGYVPEINTYIKRNNLTEARGYRMKTEQNKSKMGQATLN